MKRILSFISGIIIFGQFGCASEAVDISVVGYISHGPMQPTINAIKEITSKYGDKIKVSWYDISTESGAKYAKEHNLTAHLNILINGKYTYQLNDRTVMFQWFEGKQWKKEDLDSVISSILNSGSEVPLKDTTSVVDISVVGYISHGPMQPTINAIKEITSKYGDRTNVSWYDISNELGAKYAKEHNLTAHLNVLINGKYDYQLNDKKVVFQWFEGKQWKKEDLDSVISRIINNGSGVH
jgi:ACT domain-containing protein